VDGFEAFLIDVGVDLSGGDIGVAEEFLDDSEVGAVFEKVGGEGVAQEVRVDVLVDAGTFGAFFDDLADSVRRKLASTDGEEDLRGGFGFYQGGALAGEVSVEGVFGAPSDGDEAGFVSFTGNAEEVVVEVEGF